ncbi:MAG: hypothetical protein WA756_23790 [Pseudolabrys sp.]|jgi:hypothetical protein
MAISPYFGACRHIMLLSYRRAALAGRIDLSQRTIDKPHTSAWLAY